MSGGVESMLVLPLLEKRQYLHGTTLFDALVKHVPVNGKISLSISRRIDTDRVQIYTRSISDTPRLGESAKLMWRTAEAAGVIGVMPMPPSPQPRRHPYAEELVANRLKFGGNSTSLTEPSPFSFVATLIPMFKSLLTETTKTSGRGQWMFTRLDLDHCPEDFIPLSLSLEMVTGGTLARSTIESQGERVGALYFSWVRAPSLSVWAANDKQPL